MTDAVNDAQIRSIAESLADAAVIRIASSNPGLFRAQSTTVELPAPIKWGAGIIASIFTLASGAGLLWLVSTVNEVQITVARMDERMASGAGNTAALEARIEVLETYHRVRTNEPR